MDYYERIRAVYKATTNLENQGLDFRTAFNRALRDFNGAHEDGIAFRDEEYHSVRSGVKRLKRAEALRERTRMLAGARAMSRQAHENVCPID